MKNDLKELVQSKKFQKVIKIVGIIFCAVVIFHAGMVSGFHKARFSYRMGDNYYREFDGGRGRGKMDIRMMGERNLPNAHGSIGKIVKIELPLITIADRDGVEKVILVKDDTQIRRFRDTVLSTDLKVDNFVTVIGSPNEESQIEAKLIRLVSEPPASFDPTKKQ